MRDTIEERLRSRAQEVERALGSALSSRGDRPALLRLDAALRHGALGGGKRLRPFLVIESAAALRSGADPLPAACAIEMVHAYSLIHDDLPAMDDAETRRGKPSVHAAYDEAIGILAGDALLTEAFALLSGGAYAPAVAVRLISQLAQGAGRAGMVGGQMMDLYPEAASEEEIVAIQARKTGALIEASALMGGTLAGGASSQLAALAAYARALGLAFQIQDDVLDATADAATLGKPAGRDEVAGKATFVGLYGIEGARVRVRDLTEEAKAALGRLPDGSVLAALADWLATRER
ncbi:polyprenyl synthetase family protein [Parvularcula oceani]|uniref:polyprenyl synthetase family protein n=1 Tax=Parvularcula oceani TaxID=1247963 RepID=UPI0004E22460|nr:farnesyl diphosphate synthase [Parvularcula oceani]